jgi:hypothetical protein
MDASVLASQIRAHIAERIDPDCNGDNPQWDAGFKAACSQIMEILGRPRPAERPLGVIGPMAATLLASSLSTLDTRRGLGLSQPGEIEQTILGAAAIAVQLYDATVKVDATITR